MIVIVIQVIDLNLFGRRPLQCPCCLNQNCLCFPQHFPEKGFSYGQVTLSHQCQAADATFCRGFSQSAVPSSPEHHQEAKGVNRQGIGSSGAHRLQIGHYCFSY